MDYRVIFGVFLVVLTARAAPTDDFRVQTRDGIFLGPLTLNEEEKNVLLQITEQSQEASRPHDRHEISHGPMILNEEDRKALSIAAQQSGVDLSFFADEISLEPLALNEEDKIALLEVNKKREGKTHLHARDEISQGPLALNEEDKKALSEVNKQGEEQPHTRTRERGEISQGPLVLNEEDKKALSEVNKNGEEAPNLHTRDEISVGPWTLNEEDKKALSEVTKESEEEPNPHTGDEISKGPLVLTEEDKKALLEANNQVNQLNKENPGEEAHGLLASLLDSVKKVVQIVKRLIGKVEEHEEKSHNAVEKLRSSNSDTTDVCVRDVFGIPTRMNPVYCGVKYFSQVAMGLYDLAQSVTPLKQNLLKLQTDLAGCKEKALGDKVICTAQASRDAWENTDYIRARLGQHLTVIRFLAIEISHCIKNNHAIQTDLVNKVAQCASTSNE